MHRLLLMVSFFLTSTSAMAADPMLAATPSRNQLYWGVPFTIDLRIAPQEAVADLAIEAAGPPGFQIALPKKSARQSRIRRQLHGGIRDHTTALRTRDNGTLQDRIQCTVPSCHLVIG